MPNWLAGVTSALIPTMSTNPRHQFQWRLQVAMVLWALIGVTFMAFGVVPGFGGFARAADLQGVIKELRVGRTQQLDSQILEMRIRQCSAASPEAKQLYWSKLSPLLAEYQSITGRLYPLPNCSDL